MRAFSLNTFKTTIHEPDSEVLPMIFRYKMRSQHFLRNTKKYFHPQNPSPGVTTEQNNDILSCSGDEPHANHPQTPFISPLHAHHPHA